jgi:hypothetical protein
MILRVIGMFDVKRIPRTVSYMFENTPCTITGARLTFRK